MTETQRQTLRRAAASLKGMHDFLQRELMEWHVLEIACEERTGKPAEGQIVTDADIVRGKELLAFIDRPDISGGVN